MPTRPSSSAASASASTLIGMTSTTYPKKDLVESL